jgi:uncharacterized protein (DUF2237 family)
MGIATTSTIAAATRQLSDQNSLGTVLGASATDNIGFYGLSQGVPQATPAGNTHTVAAGSTTNVFTNTTFDGGVGTTAYTIGDLVAILKGLNLIKP